MRVPFFRFPVAVVASFASACSPAWPSSLEGSGPLPESTPEAVLAHAELSSEPRAPLDAVPRVLRLHIQVKDALAFDLTRFHLFEGDLSDAQLASADDAALSDTLRQREVAVVTWRSEEGVVVAPTLMLQQATRYVLSYGKFRVAVVDVTAEESSQTLSFRWPPEGRSPSGLLGIWCGEEPLPALQMPAFLQPSGATGLFRSGVAPGEFSTQCVHFEAANTLPNDGMTSLPPVSLHDGAGEELAFLEPRALRAQVLETSLQPPLSCDSGQLPFGPGCARVEDDRILLETPNVELLWSVQGAAGTGIDRVFSASGGARSIWPLPTEASLLLTVTTVDALGGVASTSQFVRTKSPMAHLVIDEVLANPVGPEPRQEWVELVNDGLVAASLVGMALVDVDGETLLPDVVVPPGARVLIVNEGYDPSGKWDPAPVPETIFARVPKLGKDGLSNEGEPLELLASTGEVVSTFPAKKAKAGRSVYRTDPKSLEDFATSAFGGSSPGAPNLGNSPSTQP